MTHHQEHTMSEIQIARGWNAHGWVARSGWRACRVLCTDPSNDAFVVAVTADGNVWRMVNPSRARRRAA